MLPQGTRVRSLSGRLYRPWGFPECQPLSILSPTPLASHTRTPTPLSSTTRRLTPSLRPNSPSRAPSETPCANSLNAAASLSTPHLFTRETGGLSKLGRGRHFSRAGETVASRPTPAHTLQRRSWFQRVRHRHLCTGANNARARLRPCNRYTLELRRAARTKMQTDASVTNRLLISTPAQRVSHI